MSNLTTTVRDFIKSTAARRRLSSRNYISNKTFKTKNTTDNIIVPARPRSDFDYLKPIPLPFVSKTETLEIVQSPLSRTFDDLEEDTEDMATTSVKLYKSGQRIGEETFFSSVVASYANISYNPIALAVFIIAASVALAEDSDKGPLEIFKSRLQTITLDSGAFAFKMASLLIKITNVLIANKILFIKLCFVCLPALLKPSRSNWMFTILIALGVYLFTNWTSFEILILANFWYLFTEIRDPRYRLVVVLAGAIFIYYAYVTDTPLINIGTGSATGVPPVANSGNSARTFSSAKGKTDR